jgi:citronellol/citronellal dehydrogenase
MKRFDLMFAVNVRGTYCCSQACVPYLKKAPNPHILTLAPPLNMKPKWFKDHVAYTMAKYGMSMCVLGMAEEFRADGIAVNALWPRTIVATAALQLLPGVRPEMGRKPEVLADSAYIIFNRDSRTFTGNFCIDEDVLASEGITDLDQYAFVPGAKKLLTDLFLH